MHEPPENALNACLGRTRQRPGVAALHRKRVGAAAAVLAPASRADSTDVEILLPHTAYPPNTCTQARALAQAPEAAPAPLEAPAPAPSPLEAAAAGGVPVFTLAEVATHNTAADGWIALDGMVYDVRWAGCRGGQAASPRRLRPLLQHHGAALPPPRLPRTASHHHCRPRPRARQVTSFIPQHPGGDVRRAMAAGTRAAGVAPGGTCTARLLAGLCFLPAAHTCTPPPATRPLCLQAILRGLGKDDSANWNAIHGGNPVALKTRESLLIGQLAA